MFPYFTPETSLTASSMSLDRKYLCQIIFDLKFIYILKKKGKKRFGHEGTDLLLNSNNKQILPLYNNTSRETSMVAQMLSVTSMASILKTKSNQLRNLHKFRVKKKVKFLSHAVLEFLKEHTTFARRIFGECFRYGHLLSVLNGDNGVLVRIFLIFFL